MNPAFWIDRRVLITGHTGFIGGWLCHWLQSLRARVIGYSLEPPGRPSLFETAEVGEDMTNITGDVRDAAHLKAVIAEHKPDVVIHLAAQALVRQSYSAPETTYGTNVMGTVNLLEALRHAGNRTAAIVFTSDKCYANHEWSWGYREVDQLGGDDPYSNSKACAELVTSAYRRAFFATQTDESKRIRIATVRAGNVLGGGDWAEDRLVPDVIRALIEERPIEIRRPDAVRPWQHVLEPLRGCLMLGERLLTDGAPFCRAWNLGPGDESAQTVGTVAEQLVALWGQGRLVLAPRPQGPHEAQYLKLDSSEAKSRLAWCPRWNLERTMAETVEWYKAHRAGLDMKQCTRKQIERYCGSR